MRLSFYKNLEQIYRFLATDMYAFPQDHARGALRQQPQDTVDIYIMERLYGLKETAKSIYKTPERLDYVKTIVSDKIKSLQGEENPQNEKLRKWGEVIDALKRKSVNVDDISYNQFPNLQANVTEVLEANHVLIKKGFVVTLSLLDYYYTYFAFIDVRIPIESGLLPVGQLAFLQTPKLKSLLPSFSLDFPKIVEKYFTEYRYIDHYTLLTHNANLGIPFNYQGNDSFTTYPLYFYLFDNQPVGTTFR